MFNPSRLEFARRRRGLTKKELASKVRLTPRSISMFENDESHPSEDTLQSLAEALSFPASFFNGDDIDVPNTDSVSFRALSKMTSSIESSAICASGIAFLFNDWIEQKFTMPAPDLITFESDIDPEIAASELRDHWGIGELSIRNMVHLLESKGIRVFSLVENTVDVDAYSFWKGDIPFIFLNTMKSAERSRFDAAHELGHLVLHRHGSPSGHEAERQADQFASAFLMPKSTLKSFSAVSQLATLPALIQLKKNWGVSLSALVYRMHKLAMLSEWHYRTLIIEISKRGFRSTEPEGLPREQSQVWEMVFDSLREEKITKDDIARSLDVYPSEIEALVFGLIIMNISGGNQEKATGGPSRANLRLVE